MSDTEGATSLWEEVLPGIAQMSGKTVVLKLGGSTLGSKDTTLRDVALLTKLGVKVAIVHGGGATITHWLKVSGQQAVFVDGLRVTDPAAMEVVTMVLGGKVNKDIVLSLTAAGAKCVGFSGVDGRTFVGRPLKPELGLVGEVTSVDTSLVETVMNAGFVPVIAPLAAGSQGNALNLNADTAAAELAVALNADALVFLTDVPGISNRSGDVLMQINGAEAEQLIASGAISGGMIPKAQACMRALQRVRSAHISDGRVPRALFLTLFSKKPWGTVFVGD